MKEKTTLAVLGGDQRQIVMARVLAEYGYPTKVWGLGRCRQEIGDAKYCESWENAILDADAVILPLPASADGVRIHCPLHDHDVFLRVTTLLDAIAGRRLFGGRIVESIRRIAEQKSVEWVDYYESEILQLKNALPTAEGAIAIAMQELPVTIAGVSAAVIGYGRIASLLAQKLHALGAQVTVYARRTEQLTQASLHHHKVQKLTLPDGESALSCLSDDCRVVFNTVPHRLITREVLKKIPHRCVLIDLASAPGGIDHAAAQELNIRSVWGTALPGKCTPESAGRYIAETLAQMLES
ncbi:MAG: dipicolinate synthase [Clostridia bacterium]|nr:dipicolinate synthase [Clostridia bacterium]